MSEDFINQLALASTYYEQASESVYIPSKDQSVIQKNIYDLFKETFIPHSAEVAEAQETQEKKNSVKYLLYNNMNISERNFRYADELLEKYHYKSDILLAAFAQLHNKNRLSLTEQEINQLFKALVIKAYKENKSGFDLFRILITTDYVIKSENNFLFQLKCYFYDLYTKWHFCGLNIIN